MEVTAKEMAKVLKNASDARIYCHKSPDGDAIGSAYGLAIILRSLGIKAQPFCPDTPAQVFLPLISMVPTVEPNIDAVNIAVDSSANERLGIYENVHIDMCIDHHENNTIDSEYKFVKPEASSCAQLILEVAKEMEIEIPKEAAELLFVGLITDTSCFRSLSTDTKSFEAATYLATCGADVATLARNFCYHKTRQRMEIERVLNMNFTYSEDGSILACYYRWSDLERIGISDSELVGINEIVEQDPNVKVGIIIREKNVRECRVSVRTTGNLKANEICHEFGGGGHEHAAGATIMDKDPKEVMELAMKVCVDYMLKPL